MTVEVPVDLGSNDAFYLTPTVFEVAAQELLSSGLQPVFGQLLSNYIRQRPKLRFLENWSHEIYFLGNLLAKMTHHFE